MHGEPWALHAPQEAGHHRGAADESTGSRGETTQTDGEVRMNLHGDVRSDAVSSADAAVYKRDHILHSCIASYFITRNFGLAKPGIEFCCLFCSIVLFVWPYSTLSILFHRNFDLAKPGMNWIFNFILMFFVLFYFSFVCLFCPYSIHILFSFLFCSVLFVWPYFTLSILNHRNVGLAKPGMKFSLV